MTTREETVAAGAEGGPASQTRSSAEPSWAKKLKGQMGSLKDHMRSLVCMQAKGQYLTHVARKESRQRNKRLLRTLDVHVSSGSEDVITLEAAWMKARDYQWDGTHQEVSDKEDAAGSDHEEQHEDDEYDEDARTD
ncbi:hypothetical protein ZWY2020_005939 [Hordeum vulgare]|nr:hypothetical protein ZWY2020_005939 [Hordeum vulgare]